MTGPVAEPEEIRQFTLMRSRRFAPLFWVQALGAFNDQVFKTAFLTLLTFRLADEMGLDATLHNTLAAAIFIIPFALFAPTAGQLSDGVDKARMMRWIKLAEIGLMLVAALAYHLQNLTLLYILLFSMGAQSAAFAPIKYSVLPQYLKPHELVGGNGLIQGSTFLAVLLGQIAGAKLILTDAGVTLVSIAVVAIAVLGYGAARMAPPAPPLGPPPRVDWVLPRAMWHVLRDGVKSPKAFQAIIGIAWFWFVAAGFLTLLPPFAKEVLGGGEDVFIVLLATFSFGVAIGAVLCAWVFGSQPKVRTAAWGAGGIAVFSVLLWVFASRFNANLTPGAAPLEALAFLGKPASWPVLLCFALLAGCAGLYLTPLNVVLQVSAPPASRGRLIACSNTIDALAMALSSGVAAGLSTAGLDQAQIYALLGGTGALTALWAAAHGD